MVACRRDVVGAVLLSAGLLVAGRPAKAALHYYLYQSGPDVVLEAKGSLGALPGVIGTGSCPVAFGLYEFQQAPAHLLRLCTGSAQNLAIYPLALQTPPPLALMSDSLVVATFGSPVATAVNLDVDNAYGNLFLSSFYVLGSSIVSSSIFANKTLATDFGITATGLVSTWSLTGTTETINLIVGPPVPGSLPLLGASAAFGWSRRLRRRLHGRSARHSPALRKSVVREDISL